MKFLLMDINLIYFLLILFFIINLAFAYRMKNFSLSKRNINLFNLLFLFTTLSHYLVNTDYHGIRLEMILERQGLSAFLSKIIYVFVIHPYLNVLVIVLFILSIMLIINRLLNLGSNYFLMIGLTNKNINTYIVFIILDTIHSYKSYKIWC
jgi:hypothetical protein